MKQPEIIIIYNKKDITQNISKYVMSLSYTDYEQGQSDELELQLKDNDKLLQNNWRPAKGDKLTANIGYTGERLLNCGTFTVDEVEYGFDNSGDTVIIKGLAASINEKIREKNNKSYKNKTLIEIAHQIANKHGYTVRGNSGFFKIPYIAQVEESDLAFLDRAARTYGYVFKLTDTVITFIPSDNLANKKSIETINKSMITSLSLRDTGVTTYSACQVRYLDPNGKLVTYTAKSENTALKKETLKLAHKCGSKEEAVQMANAGLKQGSKSIEGSITLSSGNTNFIAGINFDLDINNSLNGKYHVNKSVHRVTNEDYTTSGEIVCC